MAPRRPGGVGRAHEAAIQDAYNLAWKLAYVLRGQAGEGLLESYDAERAPVGKQIVLRANRSIEEFGPIFAALGRMDGKIAFITGTARGQGRAHALRLAGEGADIIATDLAARVQTVNYPPASELDLAETVKEVEALGRRVVRFTADVRDYDALKAGLDLAVAELGGLDVLVANAGILNDVRPSWELDEANWQTMIDINLTGVWHATKAAVPHLIERGPGGSMILISSTAGLRGIPHIAHYNAAKHGVLGLARTLANELAPHRIRVNSVHPTNVRTAVIDNEFSAKIYRPDLERPTFEDALPALSQINMWDVPYLEVEDVANAVLFLACEESRYITGAAVDLGMSMKYSGS